MMSTTQHGDGKRRHDYNVTMALLFVIVVATLTVAM